MFAILFILIILVVVAVSTSGSSGSSTLQMIPFDSPFTPSFFSAKIKKYSLYIENLNVKNFYQKYFPEFIYLDNSSSADYAIVNDYDIDLRNKHDFHFVATLHSGFITVITSLNLIDFTDILSYGSKKKLVMDVGKHRRMAEDLLKYFRMEQLVTLQSGASDEQVIKNYPDKIDLVFRVVESHPDSLIASLSNKAISHFLSFRTINDGDDYDFLTATEKDFYSKNPKFHTAYHDVINLIPKRYYKIVNLNRLELWIPIIQTRFLLVASKNVPVEHVADFYDKLDRLFKNKAYLPEKHSFFVNSVNYDNMKFYPNFNHHIS